MFIKGTKVLLRAIELYDAELLRQMINDGDIEEMMWGYSFPVSNHQQIQWIEQLPDETNVFRAIIDVEGRAIGTVILSNIDMRNGNAEVHIKLANHCERGKGYGRDAISALVTYAFDTLRLNCIYCRIKEDNIASQKTFEKCGFIREGCLRSRVYRNGQYYNFYEYSILKSDISKD